MELDDDEDEMPEESEAEESDDDDDDSDSDLAYSNGALSSEGEFKGVDLLYPRHSFRGARNVETVKDCELVCSCRQLTPGNFLGDRSDKIASGSDDGNWFVWDKETGKLDGIWLGDGDVVNGELDGSLQLTAVMEQHPTLPVVAVSGIDRTVKVSAGFRLAWTVLTPGVCARYTPP
jgi:nuclear receptor interaction protein